MERLESVYNFSRLKQARLMAGLTKKNLAEELGLHPATIRRIERGESQAPPTIKLVSEFLKVDMKDLVNASKIRGFCY